MCLFSLMKKMNTNTKESNCLFRHRFYLRIFQKFQALIGYFEVLNVGKNSIFFHTKFLFDKIQLQSGFHKII